MRASGIVLALSTASALAAGVARAEPEIGRTDVATLFYIAKSDDRNRVDYGIHLDEACTPVGDRPVYAYWRRFEPGQPTLGDLNLFDATGYGVARQNVRVREANGSWTEVAIAALPQRRLLVLVQRVGNRCVGHVEATIDGRDAVLDHIFVELGAPMQIREVVLSGHDRETGEAVEEHLTP